MRMTGTEKSFKAWVNTKVDNAYFYRNTIREHSGQYSVTVPEINMEWWGEAPDANQARILAVEEYEKRSKNPVKKNPSSLNNQLWRALAGFVVKLQTADKGQLKDAIEGLRQGAADYSLPPTDRTIYQKLLPILRKELKGYAKNPAKKLGKKFTPKVGAQMPKGLGEILDYDPANNRVLVNRGVGYQPFVVWGIDEYGNAYHGRYFKSLGDAVKRFENYYVDNPKKKKSRKKNPRGSITRGNRFTAIQLSTMREHYRKIKTIDPAQPSYGKLTAYLDAMPQGQLKQLANARIKWVSSLAQNRLTVKV